MADTKISALTAVTTPAGTDEFAVNQGGTSKKMTMDQIANFKRYLIRADATRTFTSNTSSQAIFTTPANGRLTLPETGLYRFQGQLAFTSMSATSGNLLVNVLGAGTATTGAWLWQAWGNDVASASAGSAVGGSWHVTNTSAAAVVTAATGTAMIVSIEGTFECSATGTLIPAITMATASASVLSIGSYIWFEYVGGTSVTSIGPWD